MRFIEVSARPPVILRVQITPKSGFYSTCLRLKKTLKSN